MGQVFFHVDLDAFFASVEQRDHPEYRGKPLIIGLPEKRSVVSTCSYEARKFGVHSAMPALQAQKLCPQGIFIPGNMHLYHKVSKQIMEIFTHYSPKVQQVSVDEAFLDMSGLSLLFSSPKEAAIQLQKEVFEQTQLTVSIGIATNRYVAKLASDYKKPNGITVVSPTKEELFVSKLGLKKLWGVGKSTLGLINSKGIYEISQLRELDYKKLVSLFSENLATYLYKSVRGIDPGIYEEDAQVKNHSISTETTFYDDMFDEEQILSVLLSMSTEVMFRAISSNMLPRTVGVKIRYGDFETTTIQATPDSAILNSKEVYEIAKKLFMQKHKKAKGIRLLGLFLSQLYEGDTPIQGELFIEDQEKLRKLDKTIIDLSKKGLKLKKASNLKI